MNETENYLISAIFSGDEDFDIFAQACEMGVSSESFTSQINATIWEALTALKGRGELLEPANVVVQLTKNPDNRIEASDVMAYWHMDSSASQWATFAASIIRSQILRKIRRELRLGLEAVEEGEEPDQIMSMIQKGFDNIEATDSEELGIEDITNLVYDNLLNPNTPDKLYLPTGLTDYDATLKGHGFGEGQLCVWAARPGLGKTTVALNVVMHNVNQGIPVGVISLEMDEEEIGEKVAVMDCGIPSKLFEDKVAKPEQMARMNKSLKKIAKLPLHIDNRSRSLQQIIQKCKLWVKRKKVKMVVIDYCQLIRGDKSLPREQQIAEISRELKLLASELKIPIILIAQLNREVEKSDRRPIMSDLRESGALEQDANSITFLYLKEEDKMTGDPDYVRWYRAKQRAGQTAEGVFGFNRPLGIFTSYDPNLLP